MVGLFPGSTYQQATLQVQPGDVLLIFTDGVTEARNPREEEFGEERLANLVADRLDFDPRKLQDLILKEIDRFVEGEPQHDDLTLAVAKVI